jgi:AhpD family alkylhydroperoxidase
MSKGKYPQRLDTLNQGVRKLGEASPAAMKGFGSLHRAAVADGALSAVTKELMALSISVAVRCDGCIAFHVHDAIEAGATKDEIHEALSVAVLMGGGPAMVYATEALVAYEEFEAERAG